MQKYERFTLNEWMKADFPMAIKSLRKYLYSVSCRGTQTSHKKWSYRGCCQKNEFECDFILTKGKFTNLPFSVLLIYVCTSQV